MGYDSKLWSVLFWVGAVLALVTQTISNPADYGLSPIVFRWIGLVGIVLGFLGGKLGQSYLTKGEKSDVDPFRFR